ncbi:MAG TPA: ABC transporter permease, partial [Candidatus Saccharimonadaceae bacterium]|nr:ABC transporter permease [Candidatus Saccharimonadaceae bacterium]
MKRSLFTVLTLYKINTRRFFRDKLALFFGIGFPLIFLFVFGALNSHNSNVSFNVALISQSHSHFAKQFADELDASKVIKVNKDVTTLSEAKQKMSRSEIDATIELPPSFGVVDPATHLPSGQAKVLYTQNDAQSGQALASVLESMFKGINGKFVTQKDP